MITLPSIHAASPWYADPVWGFVATAAQVLSLAAIAFAIYELASRTWRVAGGVITVNNWATANRVESSAAVYMVDIMNVGGAPILLTGIVVVNGSIVADADRRVRYWLAAGETMTVTVEGDDPAKIWFRFQWVSPQDRRFAFGAWQAMQRGTPLYTQWIESYDRTKDRPWFLAMFKGYFAHKVGPGFDVRTQVRITRNGAKSDKRVDGLFGARIEGSATWILGTMSDASPTGPPTTSS